MYVRVIVIIISKKLCMLHLTVKSHGRRRCAGPWRRNGDNVYGSGMRASMRCRTQ